MRIPFLILIISVIILQISCIKDTTPNQPSYQYDNMLFVRNGGGDKAFDVFPTTTPDTFRIIINHLNFRDTTITMTLSRDSTNSLAFDVLTQTLTGQNKLTGDFKQPTIPTGTWAYLYMIKGDIKTEITNTQLRNTLMDFERMVVNKLK
jgi:hypothetical protein